MLDSQQDDRDESTGFRVEDKRAFDASGRRKRPASESTEEPSGEGAAQSRPAADPRDAAGPEAGMEDTPFIRLIAGLAASALMHLGVLEDPARGAKVVDLRAARETIDLLDELRRKTEGNLDPKERELLDGQLTELRFLFVRRKEEEGAPG